ncbi:hypothetical protein IVB33_29690 [Bradyrhizobium sp. 24]|nr:MULTISPECIES: hypothetical protein [unclassified Bradyrhizobium]MCK1298057.1 hypothetical protein [Bradyrhizobium sp. 37]MCK1381084.1 hypothetical protein [Bradyrhizobium sp. 24]MCK1774181.1 hypothetical protein [Bradyrhizobium sp. 134]
MLAAQAANINVAIAADFTGPDKKVAADLRKSAREPVVGPWYKRTIL